MRRSLINLLCCLIVVTASPTAPVLGQRQFGASTTAVVVDVVVRDGRGAPVTDLQKEEFQVFEDGVAQVIADVTAVGAHEPTRGALLARSPEAQNQAPKRGDSKEFLSPNAIAIVIDRLPPETRPRVYKGLLAWVDTLQPDDLVAVYLSDFSLTTIQPYTSDRETLRRAVRAATSRGSTVVGEKTAPAIGQTNAEGDGSSTVPVVASAESVGRPVDIRSDPYLGLKVGTRTLWEVLFREQQGYVATNALLAVTTALGALPGRKSVVFIAESLGIPDSVLPHFLNVVTTANRSNVSVYAVDAAGLRVHSQDAETARGVRAGGAAGVALSADGSNQSSLNVLEQTEEVLRRSPRSGLGRLAESTGAVFFDNTNDFASALRRVDSDRRFYYLLTYTPKRSELDGKWRTISVKTTRPRVRIGARSGYVAVPAISTEPLLAYEGPALAALAQPVSPADFLVRNAAFLFPDRSGSQAVLVASARADSFKFWDDGKAYRTDFSALVRVLDREGRVAYKATQRYQLTGPLDQLARARERDLIFMRSPVIEAGDYTLEVAFHDARAERASVRRLPFTVRDRTASTVQVSDIVIVDRAEQLPAQRGSSVNPLIYEETTLLVPALEDPIKLTRPKPLMFYFVALIGEGEPVNAALELEHQGEVRATVPLPRRVVPTGRIADDVILLLQVVLDPALYRAGWAPRPASC